MPAGFAQAATPAELENAKAQFLGKSGRITELMKGLARLSVDEKKTRGAAINQAKQAIESALAARRQRWPTPNCRRSSRPRRWT
jgi:phenylalanyl-tRNA synthetase alpha chain